MEIDIYGIPPLLKRVADYLLASEKIYYIGEVVLCESTSIKALLVITDLRFFIIAKKFMQPFIISKEFYYNKI